MYANVPDSYYDPFHLQTAPRGTYARAVKELASRLNDVIGDAYMFLIEKFASDAGKKAGEFFTPKLTTRIFGCLIFWPVSQD